MAIPGEILKFCSRLAILYIRNTTFPAHQISNSVRFVFMRRWNVILFLSTVCSAPNLFHLRMKVRQYVSGTLRIYDTFITGASSAFAKRNSISSTRILAEIMRYIGIAGFLFTTSLESPYGKTRIEKQQCLCLAYSKLSFQIEVSNARVAKKFLLLNEALSRIILPRYLCKKTYGSK